MLKKSFSYHKLLSFLDYQFPPQIYDLSFQKNSIELLFQIIQQKYKSYHLVFHQNNHISSLQYY